METLAIAQAGPALQQARVRLHRLRQALVGVAKELRQPQEPLTEIEASINEMGLQVVVAGEVNRGKSTFLNALLGQKVFPPKASVCTAVLTCLRDGDPPRARVHRRDRRIQELALADQPARALLEYVGRKNPDADKIERVDVWFPNPYARDGVVIIDTPGVNDSVAWRERVTVEALGRCDAVVFLLDANKPVTASEVAFLEANVLTEWGRKIIFLVNKADTLSPDDRRAVEDRCEEQLSLLVPEPVIRFVAAKPGLQAQEEGDLRRFEESGLPAVAGLLHELLVRDRLLLYVRDREARLDMLAKRYRAALRSLNSALATEVRQEQGAHRTALDRLEKRRAALGRRLADLDLRVEAHARYMRDQAGRAWDARVDRLMNSRDLERCVDALGQGRETGKEAVRGVFASVWRDVRQQVVREGQHDLERRFGEAATILARLSDEEMRERPAPELALPATVAAAKGGDGDGALVGLVLGGLIGAATGGLGWMLLGAMGGMAVGSEMAPATTPTIDRLRVKSELNGMARNQRNQLIADAEQASRRAARGLLDEVRRRGEEQVAAQRALADERHRILQLTREQAQAERTRLARLETQLALVEQELR